MSHLDKLERKFGKYAIRNLMLYITGLNAFIALMTLMLTAFDPGNNAILKLMLIPSLVLKGEVWRLLTFLFVPPTTSPLWLVFTLYFYYMIGSSLENEWGAFRFNIYYLIGVFGAIAAAFLGGAGSAVYMNLSLIFAFSYLFPNFQIMIFFFIPVKMKYLSIFYAVSLVLMFFSSPVSGIITVLGSVINFIIFFGRDIVFRIRNRGRAVRRHRNFKLEIPREPVIHRCAICGRTERDDKYLEFRYCADCDGDHEYCMDHLYSHEHIRRVH